MMDTSDENIVQIIKGGRLLDCKGGPAIENGAVLLEGSRIVWVGRAESVPVPDGVEVVEHSFPDCMLLPGLVDAHTHLNMPGDGRGIGDVMVELDDILLLRSARNAQDALEMGVTTLRDNGGRRQTTLSLKDAIESGVIDGPRLNLCGWPLTITGGHCWPMGGEADGVDAVRAAVRNAIKHGVDYIKVMATGGSTPNAFPFLPSYSVEELCAIAAEAHRFGKLTGVHCRCTAGVVNSLDAGLDMIIHCTLREPDGAWKFDPRVAERLAESGNWVNPTVHVVRSIYWALLEQQELEGSTPELEARLAQARQDWEAQLENTRHLIEAGVKIVAGGDTGWAHFPFGEFVFEIDALCEAGMSSKQAILAATRDAAISLGMGGQVGTLEPGKEGDILVVDGNPLEDIEDLFNVEAVFLGGELVA